MTQSIADISRPNREDPIWAEEVVEIFLDLDRSGKNYAEIEISPNNVVTDVRMVSGMPDKEMDLAWNLEGLESHVRLNKYRDGRTAGWTAVAFTHHPVARILRYL